MFGDGILHPPFSFGEKIRRRRPLSIYTKVFSSNSKSLFLFDGSK